MPAELRDRPARVNAGSRQDLVRHQVADPGERPLVHQRRLHTAPSRAEQAVERLDVDGGRVGAEGAGHARPLPGVAGKPDAAKPPNVVAAKLAPLAQEDNTIVPMASLASPDQASAPVIPKCITSSTSPTGANSHLPCRRGAPKRPPASARRSDRGVRLRTICASGTWTSTISCPCARRARTRRKPSTSGSSGTAGDFPRGRP